MSSPVTLAPSSTVPVDIDMEASSVDRASSAPAAMDRRLAARAAIALVRANVRYWSGVAPLARRELRMWRERAGKIDDPVLRTLALQKLSDEAFNAEVAAMLATLAPRVNRHSAVRAIVALEVLYDYLDGLTESPANEWPDDGHVLFTAFTDAVTLAAPARGHYYRYHSRCRDSGYLQALVATVRDALGKLPATETVAEVMQRSAARGAEAQMRIHAAPLSGTAQLERWARAHAAGTPLQWREYLAGAACSVLAVHALIAAAANKDTTTAQALEIDKIYLSISVLPTILDSLIDYEQDMRAGRPGYIQYYGDRGVLCGRLASVIDDAMDRAGRAPHGAHHVMTLVGVVAYYTSAPSAQSAFAGPVTESVERRLRPLITPTLAVMRTWRAAKRLGSDRQGHIGTETGTETGRSA
jgi:tetraprenyl-beta-curcumene synthase